jgi:hypothetical protein
MHPTAPGTDPDAELSADQVEAIGLDPGGCDLDPRFPHTWRTLTAEERGRLTIWMANHPDMC